MTTVQGAQAAAVDAKNDVDLAEADLVSGKRSISSAALHKLRDGWRHADLSAQRARQAADADRRDARLKGLAAVGADIDKLAAAEHTEQLTEALRDVAAACQSFRVLAAAHDADVAELLAAAADLKAEPAAPNGPRETSGYVAVTGQSITYRRTRVSPLGGHVEVAIGHAVSGDIKRAVAEIKTVARALDPRRPDHLLRNQRSGMVVPIYGPLSDGMAAQLVARNPRSGELVELSEHDVERWMAGELA